MDVTPEACGAVSASHDPRPRPTCRYCRAVGSSFCGSQKCQRLKNIDDFGEFMRFRRNRLEAEHAAGSRSTLPRTFEYMRRGVMVLGDIHRFRELSPRVSWCLSVTLALWSLVQREEAEALDFLCRERVLRRAKSSEGSFDQLSYELAVAREGNLVWGANWSPIECRRRFEMTVPLFLATVESLGLTLDERERAA